VTPPPSVCSVCGRPPLRGADFEADGFKVGDYCDRDSYDRAAGEECEHVGRMHAEAERDAALDALRRVGCLRYTSEFPAPCKPEDEDTCSRCRGLWAGTPPGPAPSQSGSNGFQRAAPVSRDAVLEDAAREADACARERRAHIESLPAYAPPEREAAYHSLRGKEGEALRIAERVRLLKTKEPA
jgi:hypothetical protein